MTRDDPLLNRNVECAVGGSPDEENYAFGKLKKIRR